MRRLPPQNTEENFLRLLDLVPPNIQEPLFSVIDQPLREAKCPKTGKDYILSAYNRDADSFSRPELGHMNLSGSMTRQSEADYPFDEPSAHIANIGKMIEDIEIKMRNLLQEVYFGKTKDIVNDLRSVNSLIEAQRQANIQKELVGKLMERKPGS
ncbi:16120_t:CDS:2 [Acaulospora colombiana]|uniref:16120_t:CDS:1 n=1 Tax=Acaulospora colombiana TaxID=27376 RepID=A0ACA9KZC2_9GLOM|nr:16120_t:CDS:2 [Acaulospora colombiana]